MESEMILNVCVAAWVLTCVAVCLHNIRRLLEAKVALEQARAELEKRREIRDRVMSDNYYNCRKENEILHALLDQRSASDVRGR